MRRSKCGYEALRGSVLAWDESGCGSVTLDDFSRGLQQSGVGNELSKGLIEAIGRRYAGARNMVVYGGLLAKVKEAADELEDKERRARVVDGMRRRDDPYETGFGAGGGVPGSMKEIAEGAALRLRERGGRQPDDNFGDPFFSKGKTTKGRKTRPPTKPAWRGTKGHAPSTIPKPEVKVRPLPKYLRNVESRIKSDLDAARERRSKANKSRIAAAKEAVAKRRLDRHMADGLDDGDDLGAVLGEELLAREIADMYVGVVDDIMEGQGGGALGEPFEDVRGSDDDDEDGPPPAGSYVVKKGELSGWVGDFDFGKGSKASKKKVKDKDVMKGEGGEDLTARIVEEKGKEGEKEAGGEGVEGDDDED